MRTVTFDRPGAVNLARNMLEVRDCKGITPNGVRMLCEALLAMDKALLAGSDHPDTAMDAERYMEALEQIGAWASAYPLAAFPEPDWKESARVLKAAGLSLDAISAANMRHVITRVKEIVDRAMRATKETPCDQ